MSCKACWEEGQASLSLVIRQASPCLDLALWELRGLLQHEDLGNLAILNLWNSPQKLACKGNGQAFMEEGELGSL